MNTHGHLTLQIPEYCRSMEESEISDNAFNLIFAFDEIVALGYRESVNLAQIRTFVEMDSHEEKVYQAVRQVSDITVLNSTQVDLEFKKIDFYKLAIVIITPARKIRVANTNHCYAYRTR